MTFSSIRNHWYSRGLSFCLILTFTTSMIITPRASYAQGVLGLPDPGTMVNLSPAFQPLMISGLTIHPENPLLMDFIVSTGNTNLSKEQIKSQSSRLIKYFLACLTIPEGHQWVNLSPYEKQRIIPDDLGQTVLGQDMLAQDYLLKQLTASLIYPEKDLGRNFWDTVYAKAAQMYGTTHIPVNTFNKVWILPDSAKVFVRNNTVLLVKSHLRVMLDQDYLSLQKHEAPTSANNLGSQIIRKIILPAIENEVNQDANFAQLRQIYNSMILAVWFKNNLKQALLNQVYTNKAKVSGVSVDDPAIKEKIYNQYLEAYKKGVFNYIKEEKEQDSQQMVPRKYFSGGLVGPDKSMLGVASGADVAAFAEDGKFLKVSGETEGDNPMFPREAAERTFHVTEGYLNKHHMTYMMELLRERFTPGVPERNKDQRYTVSSVKKGIWDIEVSFRQGENRVGSFVISVNPDNDVLDVKFTPYSSEEEDEQKVSSRNQALEDIVLGYLSSMRIIDRSMTVDDLKLDLSKLIAEVRTNAGAEEKAVIKLVLRQDDVEIHDFSYYADKITNRGLKIYILGRITATEHSGKKYSYEPTVEGNQLIIDRKVVSDGSMTGSDEEGHNQQIPDDNAVLAQQVNKYAQDLGWQGVEINFGDLAKGRNIHAELGSNFIALVNDDLDDSDPNKRLIITRINTVEEGVQIAKKIEIDHVNTIRIGDYAYRYDQGPINLRNQWLGNDALLKFFGVTLPVMSHMTTQSDIEETLLTGHQYRGSLIGDVPSHIAGSPLVSVIPSAQAVEEAVSFLTNHNYLMQNSQVDKLSFLHYLTILSRSAATDLRNYQQVLQDRLLATTKLRAAASQEVLGSPYARMIEQIMYSSEILVVKANTQQEQPVQLASDVQAKIENETPFTIEKPQDFEVLAATFESMVKAGQLTPYIIINIKNFSPDTYLAYLGAVEKISSEHNGNFTFIISPEMQNTLHHDLPGATTALRRVGDVLGRPFYEDNHVAVVTDGGSKTRGGPKTQAHHGQFSLGTLIRTVEEGDVSVQVTNFLEMNLMTIGTTWLQMNHHYGRNVLLWPASDGIIQYGANPRFGEIPLSQLPDRFLAASGPGVEMFNPQDAQRIYAFAKDNRVSIQELIEANDKVREGYTAERMKQQQMEISEAELQRVNQVRTQFESEFGKQDEPETAVGRAYSVYDDVDLKLGDKGNFIADNKSGNLITFVEKPRFSELADKVVRLGAGMNAINIFFLMVDKKTAWDFFTVGLAKERNANHQPLGQQIISVFDRVFGGLTKQNENDPVSKLALDYVRGEGVNLIGVNYGEGSYTGDIGNLDLNAKMFQALVTNKSISFDQRRNVDSVVIPSNVTVYYGNGREAVALDALPGTEKSKALFLLKNVRFEADSPDSHYDVHLSEGSGIINSVIKFSQNGLKELKLTSGSVIVDSDIAGGLVIHGEKALLEGVTHDPKMAGSTYDYTIGSDGKMNAELSGTDLLEVFGGETTVTIFMRQADSTSRNVVVRAWNLDYKSPIGQVSEGAGSLPIGVASMILNAKAGNMTAEQARKADLFVQRNAFYSLVAQHPRLLGVEGISTWDDILSDDGKGNVTTKSLYDLKNYDGSDFEVAKKHINALSQRRQLEYNRTAWRDVAMESKGLNQTGIHQAISDLINQEGVETVSLRYGKNGPVTSSIYASEGRLATQLAQAMNRLGEAVGGAKFDSSYFDLEYHKIGRSGSYIAILTDAALRAMPPKFVDIDQTSGTNGWRDKIDAMGDVLKGAFNLFTVARMAWGWAQYLKDRLQQGEKVIVGYDNRPNGDVFAQVFARTLKFAGIEVIWSEGATTSPAMIRMTNPGNENNIKYGFLVTASHNPPYDNGIKFYTDGVVMPDPVAIPLTKSVKNITEIPEVPMSITMDLKEGEFTQIDSLAVSQQQYERDFQGLANEIRRYQISTGSWTIVDQLHGSSGRLTGYLRGLNFEVVEDRTVPMSEMWKSEEFRNRRYNEPGKSEPVPFRPEPKEVFLSKRFQDFKAHAPAGSLYFGVDGDADRLAVWIKLADSTIQEVAPNDLGVLYGWMLINDVLTKDYPAGEPKVFFIDKTQPTTSGMDFLVEYGNKLALEKGKNVVFKLRVTPVGSKNFAPEYLDGTLLIGVEESGHIVIKDYFDDAIGQQHFLMKALAKSGKSLNETIYQAKKEVGDAVGVDLNSWVYERVNPAISEKFDADFLGNFKAGHPEAALAILKEALGDRGNQIRGVLMTTVDANYETGDVTMEHYVKLREEGNAPNVKPAEGMILSFNDGSWLMVRVSGTEGVVRVYAEASSRADIKDMQRAVVKAFDVDIDVAMQGKSDVLSYDDEDNLSNADMFKSMLGTGIQNEISSKDTGAPRKANGLDAYHDGVLFYTSKKPYLAADATNEVYGAWVNKYGADVLNEKDLDFNIVKNESGRLIVNIDSAMRAAAEVRVATEQFLKDILPANNYKVFVSNKGVMRAYISQEGNMGELPGREVIKDNLLKLGANVGSLATEEPFVADPKKADQVSYAKRVMILQFSDGAMNTIAGESTTRDEFRNGLRSIMQEQLTSEKTDLVGEISLYYKGSPHVSISMPEPLSLDIALDQVMKELDGKIAGKPNGWNVTYKVTPIDNKFAIYVSDVATGEPTKIKDAAMQSTYMEEHPFTLPGTKRRLIEDINRAIEAYKQMLTEGPDNLISRLQTKVVELEGNPLLSPANPFTTVEELKEFFDNDPNLYLAVYPDMALHTAVDTEDALSGKNVESFLTQVKGLAEEALAKNPSVSRIQVIFGPSSSNFRVAGASSLDKANNLVRRLRTRRDIQNSRSPETKVSIDAPTGRLILKITDLAMRSLNATNITVDDVVEFYRNDLGLLRLSLGYAYYTTERPKVKGAIPISVTHWDSGDTIKVYYNDKLSFKVIKSSNTKEALEDLRSKLTAVFGDKRLNVYLQGSDLYFRDTAAVADKNDAAMITIGRTTQEADFFNLIRTEGQQAIGRKVNVILNPKFTNEFRGHDLNNLEFRRMNADDTVYVFYDNSNESEFGIARFKIESARVALLHQVMRSLISSANWNKWGKTGDKSAFAGPGGIDLNSKNLRLESEGDQVKLNFDKAMIAQFERGDFSGVKIKILDIVPYNPMSLLR